VGFTLLPLPISADIRGWLPPRGADSHKADFGRLAVIAGSRGKAGAAVLTARGALRGGAGLVTVFCPASIEPIIVAALPEVMTRRLPEEEGALAAQAAEPLLEALRDFDAAVAGPGLGTEKGTVALLEELLSAKCPRLRRGRVERRRPSPRLPAAAGTVLPSPWRGRAPARRTGGRRGLARCRPKAVAVERRGRALKAAAWRARLGSVTLNPTGTPLMSTAGSGDVLAGDRSASGRD
jgi:NAD(P)H-hydrate epimerase